jgi:hypothetical protein
MSLVELAVVDQLGPRTHEPRECVHGSSSDIGAAIEAEAPHPYPLPASRGEGKQLQWLAVHTSHSIHLIEFISDFRGGFVSPYPLPAAPGEGKQLQWLAAKSSKALFFLAPRRSRRRPIGCAKATRPLWTLWALVGLCASARCVTSGS